MSVYILNISFLLTSEEERCTNSVSLASETFATSESEMLISDLISAFQRIIENML